MRTEKVDRWIQIATSVAVVAGLALVVWELRQTQALTFTQIIHNNMDEISQDRSGIYGEDLGQVLVIACYSPERLTKRQAFVLDAYFENRMLIIDRIQVEVGTAGMPSNWRALSRGVIHRVLSFPQGREWIQHHSYVTDPRPYHQDVAGFIRELLADDIPSCTEKVDRMIVEPTHANDAP